MAVNPSYWKKCSQGFGNGFWPLSPSLHEHPERWSQRRGTLTVSRDATQSQQIDWFRRQFLKLADKASSTKERGKFVKLASMATLKGEGVRGADDAMQQYLQYVNRREGQAAAKFDEGRARGEAEGRADMKDKLLPGASIKG